MTNDPQPHRIILVDDSSDDCTIIGTIATQLGCTVHTFDSLVVAESAIRQLLDVATPPIPTVILLDQHLVIDAVTTGVDGWVLAVILTDAMTNGLLHHAVIVAMSAALTAQRTRYAHAAGCQLVLEKPLTRATITMLLEQTPAVPFADAATPATFGTTGSFADLARLHTAQETSIIRALGRQLWDALDFGMRSLLGKRRHSDALPPPPVAESVVWDVPAVAQLVGIARSRRIQRHDDTALMQRVATNPIALRNVLRTYAAALDNDQERAILVHWLNEGAQGEIARLLNIDRTTVHRRLQQVYRDLAMLLTTDQTWDSPSHDWSSGALRESTVYR